MSTLQKVSPQRTSPPTPPSTISSTPSPPSKPQFTQIASRQTSRTHQVRRLRSSRRITHQGKASTEIVHQVLRRLRTIRAYSYRPGASKGRQRQQNGRCWCHLLLLGCRLLRHAQRQVRRRPRKDTHSRQIFHRSLEGRRNEDVERQIFMGLRINKQAL